MMMGRQKAAGSLRAPAEQAVGLLAEEGIHVSLWDPRILKPLDRDMVRHAANHDLVVTLEDGVRVGGFGSTVNDALQRRTDVMPPRVLQVGLPTNFKVARFESDEHTALLRALAADIDAVRFDVGSGRAAGQAHVQAHVTMTG